MTRNDTPGCLMVLLTAVVAIVIIAQQGCGGGQQLSGHAAVTAACISEEQRVAAEAVTQEDAQGRLLPLRAACDTLLDIIAEDTSGGEAP